MSAFEIFYSNIISSNPQRGGRSPYIYAELQTGEQRVLSCTTFNMLEFYRIKRKWGRNFDRINEAQ